MPDTPIKPPSKPTVETLEQRLESMDKAILLLQEVTNRMPTPAIVNGKVDALKELTFEKVSGLKELVAEMLKSVQTQFEQNKVALDAALSAAKEAVSEQNKSNTVAINKSEEAFKKLLDAAGTRTDATEKATDGKIADMKDRVTAIEQRNNGIAIQRAETKETTRDSFGVIFGIIGAFIGVAGVVVAIVLART